MENALKPNTFFEPFHSLLNLFGSDLSGDFYLISLAYCISFTGNVFKSKRDEHLGSHQQ